MLSLILVWTSVFLIVFFTVAYIVRTRQYRRQKRAIRNRKVLIKNKP